MKRAVGFMVVSAMLAGSIFASDISTQDEMHQVVVQEQPAEENKSGLFSRIGDFFKDAFLDMKKSTIAQYQLDKARFEAIKAESWANFQENRFHNSLRRAKEGAIQRHQEATGYDGTQHYEAQMQEALDRKAAAEARYQAAL